MNLTTGRNQTVGTGDELNDIELEAVFQRCGPDEDTGMLIPKSSTSNPEP